MRYKDTFSSYHPLVNFLFFAEVLVFSMFFMHPASLTVSLICALIYAVNLDGTKAVRLSLTALLPMMLLAALINPMFNHEGVTILAYLPSGNPLTLESILYGIASSFMLATVVLWFSCCTKVLTSDKFVYLFGRVIPALSLILSMILRFVPKFAAQCKTVSLARRCVGRDVTTGSLLQRAKNGIAIVSILITWSLENAIETADSMKSRGYGLPGRTAFSIYRFDDRDKVCLGWLAVCGVYILCGWLAGGLQWQYYPAMTGVPAAPFPISLQLVYPALCLTPVILNEMEDLKWRRLRSEP